VVSVVVVVVVVVEPDAEVVRVTVVAAAEPSEDVEPVPVLGDVVLPDPTVEAAATLASDEALYPGFCRAQPAAKSAPPTSHICRTRESYPGRRRHANRPTAVKEEPAGRPLRGTLFRPDGTGNTT